MSGGNRYGKRSVSPRFISFNMDLTKCMIDVKIFQNMEKLVDRMQDTVNGVLLRRDITLDYKYPSVFTGADLVNWLKYNTEITTTENALYMANLLFSYGFFFSITRQHTKVTNDEHCYRFQRVFRKNTCFKHKEFNPSYNEEFFRQPRYPIGCNSFELLDLIPKHSPEINQPIFNMANTSNCVSYEDTSFFQMDDCKNKNNNITNIRNTYQTNKECKTSVGNSQASEKLLEIFIHCFDNEEFEQLLIDKLRQIDRFNNLDLIALLNYLKIQTTQPEIHRKTIRYLDNNKILYDTGYQSLKDTKKSFRVILRNLPPVTSVRKIKKELEILGFSVRQVFNMKHKTTNVSLPLFTVDIAPSHLNEEIFSIDSLLNRDVEFEEPYKKGAVEQCKNCQDFGHVWPDCVFQSRCVRCGKNHASSECTKPKNTPATCALCQGDHPANYKGCHVYKTFRHLCRQTRDDIVQSAPQANSVLNPETLNFRIPSISQPGDYQYAVYLCKKYMEVKDHSDIADYEFERLEYFRCFYNNEWRKINIQAETEIKIAHQQYDRYEKEVMDTQECAFWDLHRPKYTCNNLKIPLDYEKLLEFKELTDWDDEKIIDAYTQFISSNKIYNLN